MASEVVLLGAHGLIGSALSRRIGGKLRLHAISWREVKEGGFTSPVSGPACFVFAGGITDSGAPTDEIRYANLRLPQELIESTRARDPHHCYLTLGSVMENFEPLCASNPYLQSKLELGQWVRSQGGSSICHVQLHTIYGGDPKPHMFLGQIATALREGKPFEMSAGDQLREFHHADDIAAALERLISGPWASGPRIQDLSSGRPFSLARVAREIFAAFGRSDLLRIGALAKPAGENTQVAFARTSPEVLPESRESISGMISWLRDWLGAPKRQASHDEVR